MATYGPGSLGRDDTAPSTFGNVHTATDGRDILLNTPDGWEVERPWLWGDGPADGELGPFGNPPPGAVAGPDGHTALPVFMQCTHLIAEQIAAMPWQTYRDNTKIPTPTWIDDPMGARLDGRSRGVDVPLVRFSKPEFWSQAVISMLWFGEAIVYTPRGVTDQILTPLWLLHPDAVEVEGGRYYVNGEDGEREWLDDDEIIVIRGHVRPGKSRGYGVVHHFRDVLRLGGSVRAFALNTFRSGVPAGYLKVNQPDLTPERARALQRQWMASHGGQRKKIAVLNSVTDFKPLDLDADTVALIDMMKVTAWEVCTMFGVPTSKVGLSLSNSMTYNNAQDEDARFVKDTLRVWVDRIEAAISNRLPYGQYLKINLNSYLRANTTTRYEAYAKALDPESGWMTRDEVRALEDLPPLDTPTDTEATTSTEVTVTVSPDDVAATDDASTSTPAPQAPTTEDTPS